jgi:hypothetical protein
MRWDLGTREITDVAASFAGGTSISEVSEWEANPKAPADLRYVRVVTSVAAPVIFLRVFEPVHPGLSQVSASSVAMRNGSAARLVQ